MNTLSVVFDLATLFIVALCIWIGVSKGFLQSVFRLFSVVIALILSKLLFPYTKLFLENIFIKDVIKNFIIGKLNITPGTTEITEYSVNSLNLPDFLKTAFLESDYLQKIKHDATATLAGTVSEFVSDYALTMLSYVVTFILVGLAIIFILIMLNLFSKLPVIHFCNATLGGTAGFICACIIIWIILTAMNILLISPKTAVVFDALDKSMIARVFYKFNPIIAFIKSSGGF